MATPILVCWRATPIQKSGVATDSKEWSDATDSKLWDAPTLRAYVMLDLTSVVLYEDYTLSLLLQNYTGDVTIRTSRHVRLHSHPHA